MSINFLKYSLRTVGVLIAICFIISLFWCGDANCLSGTSNDSCASFVCSVLGKHNTPGNETSAKSVVQCSCVCHVPMIDQMIAIVRQTQSVESAYLTISLAIPSAPSDPVYHPPIAA